MTQEILSHLQIELKINRLAHQILENTFEEKSIFIGGIHGNGSIFAGLLVEILKANSSQEIILFSIEMDKENPLASPIQLSIDSSSLKNNCVVLVDDVLNSGKTMQYALSKILEQPVRIIKTVALVDRKHRRYPVKADFVGLSLSTTLKEHISISLTPGKFSAKLH